MTPLHGNDPAGQFPDSWYTATADIPAIRPPLTGATRADVCIVGAGYTGLTAARYLAEKGLDVVVLDAHRAGFGASGRNGGQVGSGHNTGQIALAARYGRDQAARLWALAEEAKDDLRGICQTHIPQARYTPGILHGVYSAAQAAAHRKEIDYRHATYGYDQADICDAQQIRAMVNTPHFQGGSLDMGAGHIHPLRYALGLAKLAETAGTRLYERTEVTQITKGDPVTLQTPRGHVTANHVILAGNGYLSPIADRVAAHVMPFNSFICATEPLGAGAQDILTRDVAVEDSKHVVHYFRLSEDRRLLFGGRASYGVRFPRQIAPALRKRMCRLFPQLHDVRIDYAWGGTLGMTLSRLPAVQRLSPNIISGAGFSGHGVALSGLVGKVMAEAVAGQAARFDTLTALAVPKFPGGPALRPPLMALGMMWYNLRDHLGI